MIRSVNSKTRCDHSSSRQLLSRLLLCLLWALVLVPGSAAGDDPPKQVFGAEVSETIFPYVFEGDLRDLPLAAEWQPGDPIKEIPRRHYFRPGEDRVVPPRAPQIDPLLEKQANVPKAPDSDGFNLPIHNMDGQGFSGVNPPDTVGDVGAGYYIQMINGNGGTQVTFYNSETGAVAAGPITLDSLWTGGGACASGFGDPIVLYDRMADRWMLSEFAGSGNHLCVYVSQSNDPISGGWFLYDFPTPNFPDYPKYAVWPDAYYVTTNEATSSVYALDRASMLVGSAATSQRFTIPDLSGFGFQTATPADLDGEDLPVLGEPDGPTPPGIIMRHRDTEVHGPSGLPSEDLLEMWEFSVDWATPGNSSLTQVPSISVSEFDSDLCGLTSFNCFPQPGTSTTLDPLREVIMWRLQYRNMGSHEVLVGNLVTDVDGTDHGGIRWFELRRGGFAGPSDWTLFQEGTYSPDADSRFMGGSAMDVDGNIAVGYNISSSSTFPSLGYVGRLAGDPAGTMPHGETILVSGTASNGSNRYGDYSAMSVDPVDDCTFWFTGEYNSATTWSTRIGAFKFDSCVPGPDFTIDVTPSEQAICAPIDADYTVEIGSVLGFNDSVDLDVLGAPAGTTPLFSDDPVTPPNTSILTIADTGSATPGEYTLQVSGTSTTGTKSRFVDLSIFSDTPSAPTLLMPANGAVDVALAPTYSWTASTQGATYILEVDDDAGFGSIDYAFATTDTSHTATSALAQSSTYFWRVTPSNQCGDGTSSSVFSFTTRTLPPVLLVDDDDNAPDVRGFYTASLGNLGVDYDIWDTGNGDNEPSEADLAGYSQVIWFTGDEFGGAAGPSGASEDALGSFLDNGACLFMTSQDYHYDRGLTPFMQDYLGVDSMTDDNGDYTSVSGETGSIFDGMGPYALDYAVPGLDDFSDPVTAGGFGAPALLGNNANGAAVQQMVPPVAAPQGSTDFATVFFAFPWEALDGEATRDMVLQTILDACPAGPDPSEVFDDGFESGDTSAWSSTVPPIP